MTKLIAALAVTLGYSLAVLHLAKDAPTLAASDAGVSILTPDALLFTYTDNGETLVKLDKYDHTIHITKAGKATGWRCVNE